MAKIALIVFLALLPFAVASPAGSVAKRVYHDPLGDAPCCTRDLTDIAVSNADAQRNCGRQETPINPSPGS